MQVKEKSFELQTSKAADQWLVSIETPTPAGWAATARHVIIH